MKGTTLRICMMSVVLASLFSTFAHRALLQAAESDGSSIFRTVRPVGDGTLSDWVKSESGEPMHGIVIKVKDPTRGITLSVFSRRDGKFQVLGGPDRYFDPSAFSLPQAGFFGNVGRHTLSCPGLVNFDFSLLKRIPISEKYSLQLSCGIFQSLQSGQFWNSQYKPLWLPRATGGIGWANYQYPNDFPPDLVRAAVRILISFEGKEVDYWVVCR